MSVTRTFTVTVANAGGNKYFIDGVQQATLNLAENGTYRFDQSDNSNNGHPLKLSTTSNGTHGGGSEYTTGVTYNGIPGQAEAYTQIVVADSAPTLYYYCQIHSGMGGQANTVDDDTYGMWAWGTNEWGDQGPIVFTPTGVVATSSVGSVTATELIVIQPTGLSTTSSLGSLSLQINSTISLTGLQTQSELGTFDNAGTLVGWGRNGWSEEPWGDSFNVLIQPAGLSATSSVGSVDAGTGVPLTGVSSTSSVGSLSPADVMGLTGLSTTSSVGSVQIDNTELITLTGQSITSSVGSLIIEIGVPLTGLSTTSAVGSISPSDVIGLTGLSTTSSVGTLSIIGYKNIDITGNTSYTNVTHVA